MTTTTEGIRKLRYSGDEVSSCIIAKDSAKTIEELNELSDYNFLEYATSHSNSLVKFRTPHSLKQRIHKDLEHENLLGLSILEFNVTDLCNRKCWMCPRHLEEVYPNRNEHMSFETLKSVIDEVSKTGWKGNIIFGGWGEPLLNPDLVKMLKYTSEKMPDSSIEVVTNGDRLLDKKIPGYDKPFNVEELVECGVSIVYLDVYDDDEMFLKHVNKLEPILGKVEVYLARRYMDSDPNNNPFVSRAGMYDVQTQGKQEAPMKILDIPCNLLMYKAFIDYNGELLMCCHDWSRSHNYGNVNTEGFVNLWNSENMENDRKTLTKSRKLMSGVCKTCDSAGGQKSKVARHVKQLYENRWSSI